MKTWYTVALSMVAGAALGVAALQGVHAQLAAKKAYTATELQTLNAQAAADFAKRVGAAQTEAGGRNFRTGGRTSRTPSAPHVRLYQIARGSILNPVIPQPFRPHVRDERLFAAMINSCAREREIPCSQSSPALL
jgi:hypothetical protein